MSDPSAQVLKKHIRSIVAKAKGEPVGLKTLLKQLETDLNLQKGSLTARKNEVRDLLVAVMEEEGEEEESSSEEEVVHSRSSKQLDQEPARGRAVSGVPKPVGLAGDQSGGQHDDPRATVLLDDEEASDKTAGKSRAGQNPDFAGFLKKRGDQGRLKLWRKRHFRLYKKEGVIAYFKSDKDTEQLGEVSVVGAFLIDKRDDLGKFCFAITMKTTARVWILQAADEPTMNQWLTLCQPLMKEVATVRVQQGGKKPPKPANGLPLLFPPTYVQGFAEREQCTSVVQDAEDWTKLTPAPAAAAVLAPGQVALSLHGSGLAVIEEVREIGLDASGEAFVQDVPKQLKYSADTVSWSAPDSQLVQYRFQMDEKTQRELLKKLVGRVVTCSVPGNGAGHHEDVGKRQETRQKVDGEHQHHHHHHHAHSSGAAAFPDDAKFTGRLYYDQHDERYALVEEASNTVHFLNTRDARTIQLTDTSVSKLNEATTETFIAPRLWIKFQAKERKTQGLLTYHVEEAFEVHTNYVLLLSPDEKSADIEGLFSVKNKTSKTFKNAKLRIVTDPQQEAERKKQQKAKTLGDAAAEVGEEKLKEEATKKLGAGVVGLASFLKKEEAPKKVAPPKIHHYPVLQAVTLPSYDWAHVAFLSTRVPVKTMHLVTFTTPKYTVKPQVAKEAGTDAVAEIFTVARFQNPLPAALPSGSAEVNRLERSGFGAVKLADVELGRVEGGEIVTLQLEELAGVTATRVQTGFNFDGEKHFIIETFEITVANGRNETVNITVEDSLFRWSNYEITASKPPHQPTSHPRRIAWELRLNNGEHCTIKYTSFSQSFDLESDYAQ